MSDKQETHALFAALDELFDQNPLNMREIEEILRKLTKGVVDATLKQRVEELTAPFMAGFNRLAHEIRWRCAEDPDNADLHVLKGRFEQVIETIDIADDTALSTIVIQEVVNDVFRLTILTSIADATTNEVGVDEFMSTHLRRDLEWMEDRQLIKWTTPSTITFGTKGEAVLKTAQSELKQPK